MFKAFSQDTELLILRLLKDAPPEGLFGLDLVRLSEGKLSRGSVYVTLGRLEEEGHVESQLETASAHPGLARPRYRSKDSGRRRLAQADADVSGLDLAGAAV